jgi:predicted TIM-barrel fold metal-dependent hydrolase
VIVDTNVYLSRWPFRRLPDDEPAALAARLRKHGVTEVWAGSFDGVFHKDIGAVNARLAGECSRFGPGLFVPFGTVNPMLPDWRDDLRRCHELHRMPGIRVHPNYHGYALDDPGFAELLRGASERGLIVQLVVQMEDDRMQHRLMKIPPVDLAGLPKLAEAHPKLRLMLLNGFRSLSAAAVKLLARMPAVRFEIAMLDGVGGVSRAVDAVSPNRVLFGSHSPFYYFESALLKVKEAGLPEAVSNRVRHANARELLPR